MSAQVAAPSRTPIADCLELVGSHEIVDLGWWSVELAGAGYQGLPAAGRTWRDMARAIEARGLGGGLLPELYPGQLLVAGYMMAATVARQLTGTDPGAVFHGRGSAYRASLAAVRAWELAQADGD